MNPVEIAIESYRSKIFIDGYISRFVFGDGSAVPAMRSMYNPQIYYTVVDKAPAVLALLAEESKENGEWREAGENEYANLKKVLNLRKLEYRDFEATISLHEPILAKKSEYSGKSYRFYTPGRGLGILYMKYRTVRTAKMDYGTFLLKRQIAEKFAEKGITVSYSSEKEYEYTKFRIMFHILLEIREIRISIEDAIEDLKALPQLQLSDEELDKMLKSSIEELKSKLLDA